MTRRCESCSAAACVRALLTATAELRGQGIFSPAPFGIGSLSLGGGFSIGRTRIHLETVARFEKARDRQRLSGFTHRSLVLHGRRTRRAFGRPEKKRLMASTRPFRPATVAVHAARRRTGSARQIATGLRSREPLAAQYASLSKRTTAVPNSIAPLRKGGSALAESFSEEGVGQADETLTTDVARSETGSETCPTTGDSLSTDDGTPKTSNRSAHLCSGGPARAH